MTIYLKQIKLLKNKESGYPFNIRAYKKGINISIKSPILILVWENWAGKSTLLEAISDNCGFSLSWWNQNHHYWKEVDSKLSEHLRLSWFPKIHQGFYMRADSFLAFSDYIDKLVNDGLGSYDAYWGDSLNAKSHWEAFFSLFNNHFKKWLYILDEPDSALSPTMQIAFIAFIKKLINEGAQFIIATHSPILMSFPDSQLLLMDNDGIRKAWYKDTEHYKITKLFLDSPERFYKQFN